MYLIQIDHIVYENLGGGTFTLVEALGEVYGVRNARILREDGTVAVERAGSASVVVHAPTRMEILRRPVRRGVTQWRPPIDRTPPPPPRPAFEVVGIVVMRRDQ